MENFHQQAKSKETLKNDAERQLTNGNSEGDHMTNGLANLSLSNNHVTNGSHHNFNETGDHQRYPVDLDLEHILGKMPQKVVKLGSLAIFSVHT